MLYCARCRRQYADGTPYCPQCRVGLAPIVMQPRPGMPGPMMPMAPGQGMPGPMTPGQGMRPAMPQRPMGVPPMGVPPMVMPQRPMMPPQMVPQQMPQQPPPQRGSSSPLSRPAAASPGQVIAGRYQILRWLGAGGMGTVYLARDMAMNQDVAVKQIWRWVDPTRQKERFLAEAKVMAALQHPGIVSILAYGDLPGWGPYLVLEYLPNGDLQGFLAKRGALPPGQVLDMITPVASALQHGHSQPQPVVHADVKPANVLLASDWTPRLADFGLFRTITTQGGIGSDVAGIGTEPYMSPEQRNDPFHISPGTDQYALAKTAVQLLTNEVPYDPDLDRPGIPVNMRDILARAMRHKPYERYPHIAEFVKALREAYESGPKTVAAPAPATTPKKGPAPAGEKQACASCGTVNAPEERFCNTCGHELFSSCPKCHKPVRSSTKHCPGCGANLLDWAKSRRDKEHAEDMLASGQNNAAADLIREALKRQCMKEELQALLQRATGS